MHSKPRYFSCSEHSSVWTNFRSREEARLDVLDRLVGGRTRDAFRFLRLYGVIEAVPKAAHRTYEDGIRRVRFNLLSKTKDIHIHRAVGNRPIVPPYRIQ